MNYRPKMQLPPPDTWEAFEDLCCGLWKAIWNYPGTKKNGRKGQKQNGVDIHGRPDNGDKWAGIQCKGKDSYTHKQLTESEIIKESQKARNFNPRLSEYIIVSTAPTDQNVQSIVNTLSDVYRGDGWFSIDVRGWEDIVDLLYEHTPPCASHFYPQVFGGELSFVAGKILGLLESVIPSSFSIAGNNTSAVLSDEGNSAFFASKNYPVSGSPSISTEEKKVALDLIFTIQQEYMQVSAENGESTKSETLAMALERALSKSNNLGDARH